MLGFGKSVDVVDEGGYLLFVCECGFESCEGRFPRCGYFVDSFKLYASATAVEVVHEYFGMGLFFLELDFEPVGNARAARGKLDWFVAEQVEEEETAKELIDRLKLIGDNGLALYMLDQELAARTYTVPAPLSLNWILNQLAMPERPSFSKCMPMARYRYADQNSALICALSAS